MKKIRSERMKTSPIFVGGYTMNSQSNEKNMDMNRTNQGTPNIRWMLVGYDLVVYVVVSLWGRSGAVYILSDTQNSLCQSGI